MGIVTKYEKLSKLLEFLTSIVNKRILSKFTGWISVKIHFSEGGIAKIEKQEFTEVK